MTRALQSTYNLYTSHGLAVHQPPVAGVGERSCSTDSAHFADTQFKTLALQSFTM